MTTPQYVRIFFEKKMFFLISNALKTWFLGHFLLRKFKWKQNVTKL
ncbi:MAG: hypothetical protein RL757_2754 [Bacteroidota bacterium]|jgi:hypothetical protein